MPRPLRIQYPGAVYHVTNRGDGRQALFTDAADAQRFLDLFAEIAAPLGWRCYAYCLMTHYYHLVVETPEPNLSAGMQALAGRYTQDFNRRHKRDGHLFRGRFHAILVERDSYLVPLVRYVVLNPVLAVLAKDPAAWRWSSYRATAGAAVPAPPLDLSWLVGPYAPDLPAAQAAWRAHVALGMAEPEKVQVIEPLLKNRSILGGAEFVRETRRRGRQGPARAGIAKARPTRAASANAKKGPAEHGGPAPVAA